MDFEYTEEQKAIRAMVRQFVEKEVAAGVAERDRTGAFDYKLYGRLGELGISGMRFPEEYGGTNADFLAWCLALEELGKAEPWFAVMLMVATGAANHIIELGNGEQKETWKEDYILPIVQAKATASSAITEPGAGSDTAAIQTTAVLDGNHWVINGAKAFITNAGLKNNIYTIVLAVTDREKREFSSILVPVGTTGYTISTPYRVLGKPSELGELYFENCRVPAFNLIGQRGIGRRYIVDKLFAEARTQMGAIALGCAQACYEQSLNYAQQRIAFRRPISKFQFVQAMLVDMALEIELSRLLRDKAALAIARGNASLKLSSMVKYFCCEAAKRATDHAVQIHGGTGVMDECPVSRFYRDIRSFTIADGATEIQKWIIAREIGC